MTEQLSDKKRNWQETILDLIKDSEDKSPRRNTDETKDSDI